MKLVELLKISCGLLKYLSENDAKIDDWKYLVMYERFKRMRQQKVKHTSAVEQLAKDYNISRASVERIIRRFRKECL